MQYRKLGNSDIDVSVICLGTMTWGVQNSEADAHEQMDYAIAKGINFFDTAEMYPVPPSGDTQGRTESYIGTWFKKTGRRKDVVLATKVVGASEGFQYLRDGNVKLDRKNILAALDASLKRLQTDYIDLYQMHWPDRTTNYFGQLGYKHNASEDWTPLEESLAVMQDCVKAGKIRYVGLSNETPWGVMRCLQLAERLGLPRVMSVQNPYNLLNRSYEVGLAEISIREQCGLLAYSPLAFGVLTGKYIGGNKPANARLTMYDRFQRYRGELAEKATERYAAIARKNNISLTQMALAFVNMQDFVTSNIIGATTIKQLEENIASADIILSPQIISEIDAVHREISNPCP